MKKTYKYTNTRQYIRLPASYLIRYRTLEKREVKEMDLSTTEDISAGGVSFIVREKLVPSSTVELEISFPATTYPIKAIAKVIRTEQTKVPGVYKTAVQFIKINEEDKKAVDEYIKQKEGDKPTKEWWWRKF